MTIDERIDSTQEKAGDGRTRWNTVPDGVFDTVEVGVHGPPVLCNAEEQRDVYVDAARDESPNGGHCRRLYPAP